LKIIDLEQGSDEWLKFRESHITATDVSAILGINSWKTAPQLWEEKMGMLPPIVQNARMKRGQDLEPIARQTLIDITQIDFKPVVVVHDVEPWAMASLDGYCYLHNVICEIKCPNMDTHNLALSGGLKPYYMSQVQWQLWITGAEECIYFSYMPDYKEPTAMIKIFPDPPYIEKIVESCRRFYEDNICSFSSPKFSTFQPR